MNKKAEWRKFPCGVIFVRKQISFFGTVLKVKSRFCTPYNSHCIDGNIDTTNFAKTTIHHSTTDMQQHHAISDRHNNTNTQDPTPPNTQQPLTTSNQHPTTITTTNNSHSNRQDTQQTHKTHTRHTHTHTTYHIPQHGKQCSSDTFQHT